MPDNCNEHGDELRGSIRCATLQAVRPLAPSSFRRICLTCVLVLALVASACSGDDNNVGERGLSGPRPAPTIAGRVVDGFAPGIDDRVAIVGVASDETLPMRVLPGVDQAILTEIPPTAVDLFGFGQAIETEDDNRLWWLVRYGDAQGWIEPGAAYLGAPEDISVAVAGQLENTSYDSIEELVQDVQRQFDGSVLVGTSEETDAGDIAATIDSLGSSDDALAGERIIINANSATGSYRLTGAQRVPLCARGVNDSGLCA